MNSQIDETMQRRRDVCDVPCQRGASERADRPPAEPASNGGTLVVATGETASLIGIALRQAQHLKPLGICRDGRQALDVVAGSGGFTMARVPRLIIWELGQRRNMELLQELKREGIAKNTPVIIVVPAQVPPPPDLPLPHTVCLHNPLDPSFQQSLVSAVGQLVNGK